MTELGFPPKSEMRLFCDNKATIKISHNPVQHDRTKHVEVDRHFVQQNLDAKVIKFPFVRSEDQWQMFLQRPCRIELFTAHLSSWVSKISFHPLEWEC